MNGHRYIATLRIFHRRDLSGSLQTILTIPTLPPRSPYHHTAMTRRPCLRPTTYDLRRTYDPLPDIILDLYSIPTSSLSTWVLHIVYIINRSWTSDSLSFVVVCCCLLSVVCCVLRGLRGYYYVIILFYPYSYNLSVGSS